MFQLNFISQTGEGLDLTVGGTEVCSPDGLCRWKFYMVGQWHLWALLMVLSTKPTFSCHCDETDKATKNVDSIVIIHFQFPGKEFQQSPNTTSNVEIITLWQLHLGSIYRRRAKFWWHETFGKRVFESKENLKETAVSCKPSSFWHGAKDWQQLNAELWTVAIPGFLRSGQHDVTLL